MHLEAFCGRRRSLVWQNVGLALVATAVLVAAGFPNRAWRSKLRTANRRDREEARPARGPAHESSRAQRPVHTCCYTPQSGRLVSLVPRGLREGQAGRQADLSLDRLQQLPLVPRDGAASLRERRHRPRDE